MMNKKKTAIFSIAAIALTACITTVALLLTNNSEAAEVEKEETTTPSATEEVTIKPIVHTTEKTVSPIEAEEENTEKETETITLTPDPEEIEVVTANTQDPLEATVSSLAEEGIPVETLASYETSAEITEEPVFITQATEAPNATEPNVPTTSPPPADDWSMFVEDDGILGGGWGDLGQRGEGGWKEEDITPIGDVIIGS